MPIEFINVSKSYGRLAVLKDFSATFEGGKISAILGASGCGKTTMLNCVSKLSGYGGLIKGADRKISYIFQEPRLLPNLTVSENIEYVLRSVYPEKTSRLRVAEDVLKLVEMTDYAGLYPSQLSGGMAQRVSIARAFAYPSTVLLMDEPFKGLDIGLKHRLLAAFLKTWDAYPRTTLYVTHDVDESLLIADKVFVLKGPPVTITKNFVMPWPAQQRKHSQPELSKIRSEILDILL